ncbi:hypothetical protein GRI89_09845 [Altererythrobacter salegens]|uniref:Peptidase C14 caspase domain-containing protein n=1 Tax=Croceibacterium salegens TaxID=1737568 RepID=A0A6I4SVA8_9SPHN|nr:caspase family protein [Croceibacterium salegens]MXO59841.1 hypothetical protein [Croceibacterium salegens]
MGFLHHLQRAGIGLAGAVLLLPAACSDEIAPDYTERSDIKPQLVVQVGHAVPVEAVAWAQGGEGLISLGIDGSLVVWDVASRSIISRSQIPVDWRDRGLATDEGETAEGYFGQRCIRLDEFSLSGSVLTVAYREDRSQFVEQEGEGEPPDDRLANACSGFSVGGTRRFAFTLNVETWQENAPMQETAAEPVRRISLRKFTTTVGDTEVEVPEPDPNLGGAVHVPETVAGGAVHVPEPPPPPPSLRAPPPIDPSRVYYKLCLREGRCNYELEDAVRGIDGSDLTRFFPASPDGSRQPRPNFDDGKPGYASIYADRGPLLDFSTCPSINTCRFGVTLFGPGEVIELTGEPPSYFRDADVSSDGRQVVRVAQLGEASTVDVLDLGSGQDSRTLTLERPYHRVNWITPGRFALFSEGSIVSPMMRDMMRALPPALVVDPQCKDTERCAGVESYSGMEPVDDVGGFLGIANLDHCHASRYPSRFAISGVECEAGLSVDIVHSEFSVTTLPPSVDFPDSPVADTVSLHSAADGWQRLAVPGLHARETITALKVSPDRRSFVVATRTSGEPWMSPAERKFRSAPRKDSSLSQTIRILAFSVSSDGQLVEPRSLAEIKETLAPAVAQAAWSFDLQFGVRELRFTPDSRRVIFSRKLDATGATYLYVLPAADKATSLFATGADGEPQISGQGLAKTYPFASELVVAIGNERAFGLDNTALIDLTDGAILYDKLADTPMVKAGYIAPSDMLWAASSDGAIHYWGAADGQALMSLYTFPGNTFFAVSPGGRYDTNLPPDSNQIRWLMADKPWQSLAPQTFMRDYYEPGMYRQILECREHADTCKTPFRKPLPSIESLNRVLPAVRIASVLQTEVGGSAIVTVDVTPGRDMDVDGGAPQGIYNLRLFRNGRLVATDPFFINRVIEGDEKQDDSVAQWRSDNVLPYKGGVRPSGRMLANGDYRMMFLVPLPSGLDPQPQVFSAYAFNEDRIKSATAYSKAVRANPSPRRPRRAYVINIGIDHYDRESMRLRFAGNDARLLSDRLDEIPGYEVRKLVLTAEDPKLGTGTARRIGRYTILRALNLLHDNPFRETLLNSLREDGIDASMIEPATPDDIVILTYSGHGDTDKFGNFYLLPSDGTWAFGDDVDLESLVSAADLSNALAQNQAGETALIIDACRSAASVEAGDFKPAPVGDSGLGQLAYDKGILILAAAQSSESAMEDGKLKHGLATFALAANGEGLSAKGDLDADGSIRLDEWLQYAVDRMPGLNDDRRHLLYDADAGRFVAARGTGEKKTQTPALFDFNATASPVLVRRGVRQAR